MAQKTYAPQLVRMLKNVTRYCQKHGSKIAPVLTSGQAADLSTILGAISSGRTDSFINVNTTEQP